MKLYAQSTVPITTPIIVNPLCGHKSLNFQVNFYEINTFTFQMHVHAAAGVNWMNHKRQNNNCGP